MTTPDAEAPGVGLLDTWKRFVDPAEKHRGELGRLAGILAEKRSKFTSIELNRGLGKISLAQAWSHPKESFSGLDSVFAEAATLVPVSEKEAGAFVHALTSSGPDFEVKEKVLVNRFMRVAEAVERHTDETASRIVDQVDSLLEESDAAEAQRADYSMEFGVEITKNTSRLVLAGLLMSGAAHSGLRRENKNRPYMTHVVATACMAEMAWNEAATEFAKERKRDKIPEKKHLFRQIFLNLMHDTFEEQVKKDGQSYLEGDSSRITPLLVQRVLEKLADAETGEVKNSEAKTKAKELLAITKTRDYMGEAEEHEVHISGINATICCALAKLADTLHNKVVDSKSSGKDNAEEYQKNINKVLEKMSDSWDEFGVATASSMIDIANKFINNHDGLMQQFKESDLKLGEWSLPA